MQMLSLSDRKNHHHVRNENNEGGILSGCFWQRALRLIWRLTHADLLQLADRYFGKSKEMRQRVRPEFGGAGRNRTAA